MLFDKKGDLTIRTIVLFLIGLIVMIVVVLIFLYGTSEFTTKLQELFASIWSLKPDFGQ